MSTRTHMKNVLSHWALGAAAILLLVGCGDKSLKKVIVEAEKTTQGRTITLHIIAVNEFDLPRLQSYSVDKYWEPGDPVRRSFEDQATKLEFKEARKIEYTPKSPEWGKWFKKGNRHVVVIADLPTVKDDAARRQVVPLFQKGWAEKKVTQVKVRVQDAQVRIQPE